MSEAVHQIGEVADAVGLSLRTIRHYEETGLVPPSGRSAGGFRLYTDDDIGRLRLIKQMKPLEFSLEQLRELLDVRDLLAEADGADQRAALQQRLAMFVGAAEERCARLRGQLDAAEALVRMLRREASPRQVAARSRR